MREAATDVVLAETLRLQIAHQVSEYSQLVALHRDPARDTALEQRLRARSDRIASTFLSLEDRVRHESEPETYQHVSRLQQQYEVIDNLGNRIIAEAKRSHGRSQNLRLQLEEVETAINLLNRDLDDFVASEEGELVEGMGVIHHQVMWLKAAIIGFLLTLLISGIAGPLMVSRAIVQSIDAIQSATHQISAGDYKARLQIESKDELEDLATSFNAMSARLARTIEESDAQQAQLRELQAQLQLILDSTVEAICGVDISGKCVFCNPAFLQLTGYTAEEVIGHSMHDLIHHTKPDGTPYPAQECGFLASLAHGEAITARRELLWKKDGSSFHSEFWSHPVEEFWSDASHQPPGAIAHVATLLDITERTRAENARQEAHLETEFFLDAIRSVIIGTTQDGIITRWNHAAEEVLGPRKAQAVGRRLTECGVQWLDCAALGLLDHQLRQQQQVEHDNIAFEKDGQRRLLALSAYMAASGSRPTIIMARDVTRKRFLDVQESQAQKLEAIGQLAAGIAHEINTPTQYVADNAAFLQQSWSELANVLAAYGMAVKEAGTGCLSQVTLAAVRQAEQAADFDFLSREIPLAIEGALEGVQRIAKIVRAMKDFSHPDSAERKAVDINKAIETTITVAHNEWKYVADVVTDFDAALSPVPCFAGEFNQVILNLLVNAVHAIQAVVADGNKGLITVRTRRKEDAVEIVIADTGHGIPEAIRSRVFDPFFTTKPLGKGTGQRLALAYTIIVKKHKGKIWFDTELGKGTRFYLLLPLDADV